LFYRFSSTIIQDVFNVVSLNSLNEPCRFQWEMWICEWRSSVCDHIIDTRPEWRTFQNDEDEKDASRVRVGAALETAISSKGKSDLTKTHFKATVDKNTLTLKHALHEIEAMCTLMDLSKEVIDTTKQLYKLTVEEKSNSEYYRCCNYSFITNTLNIPISIEKIALVSGMAVHSIKSVSRMIYSEKKKCSDLLGD
ncbi:12857_t:CDS:2, partial [Gigaspora margarita]